eukprot:GHVH01003250.1.p1 GENE.GHVH01003250.1~~GHVH01003250.1.p1  ORF type:complete len:140 (+),score=15.06 GHVH01003250.1:426-845(+)
MKTPWQSLEIQEDSPMRDIRIAFLRLSLKYHPDKPSGNRERFEEILQAYQFLYNGQISRVDLYRDMTLVTPTIEIVDSTVVVVVECSRCGDIILIEEARLEDQSTLLQRYSKETNSSSKIQLIIDCPSCSIHYLVTCNQ